MLEKRNALFAQAMHRCEYTIARFLLDGPVLPLVTNTLPVAEAFRHALLRRYQRHCHRQKYAHADRPYQEQFRSDVLAGKDAAGQCLQQHRHAYYLPTAESPDPRWLTHVTVAAAAGFGPDEVAALNALRTLSWADEAPELRVQLVGLGDARAFRAPLLEEAAVWVSATPFLASRYPKRRGTRRDRPEHYATPHDFVRHVLGEEIERLRERRPDLPALVRIESLEVLGPPPGLRPLQFRRFRRKAGDDGGRRPAGAFRLTFAQPVGGPLCLGHSCHFGLGLFVPDLQT